MIEKLAKNMASFYVQKNYIPENERISYKYGFEILLSTACNIIFVLGISILLHSLAGAISFMVAFIILRKAGGGYHAKNHWMCITIFLTAFVVFFLIITLMDPNLIIQYNFTCVFVSALIIYIVAPVEASNNVLSAIKRTRYRIISIFVGSGFIVLSVITYLATWITADTATYIFSGELTAAVSMAVASIKGRGGEDH